MERIRRSLSMLPPWIFTAIVTIAILWLTLAPKPLGDNPPPLFPGADKLAHSLMFGGLAIVILIDQQRRKNWKPEVLLQIFIAGLISAFFGIMIEFVQAWMGLGRGFEYGDIVADTTGAFFFAFLFFILQKSWLPDKPA
ncbi:MAG: VanZ family protein [Muribaculaceae bacterium]|nr:VanZ family protein [Muribaculaceae bacterium]